MQELRLHSISSYTYEINKLFSKSKHFDEWKHFDECSCVQDPEIYSENLDLHPIPNHLIISKLVVVFDSILETVMGGGVCLLFESPSKA